MNYKCVNCESETSNEQAFCPKCRRKEKLKVYTLIIICFIIVSCITTAIKMSGVMLGLIPVAMIYGLLFYWTKYMINSMNKKIVDISKCCEINDDNISHQLESPTPHIDCKPEKKKTRVKPEQQEKFRINSCLFMALLGVLVSIAISGFGIFNVINPEYYAPSYYVSEYSTSYRVDLSKYRDTSIPQGAGLRNIIAAIDEENYDINNGINKTLTTMQYCLGWLMASIGLISLMHFGTKCFEYSKHE